LKQPPPDYCAPQYDGLSTISPYVAGVFWGVMQKNFDA
jgi:hypothetical protein